MIYIKSPVEIGDKVYDKVNNIVGVVYEITKSEDGVWIHARDEKTGASINCLTSDVSRCLELVNKSTKSGFPEKLDTDILFKALKELKDNGGFVLGDQESQYIQMLGLITSMALKEFDYGLES